MCGPLPRLSPAPPNRFVSSKLATSCSNGWTWKIYGLGREPNCVKLAQNGHLFRIDNEAAEDLKATTVILC